MATLRKWQPVNRRPVAKTISPDKVLVMCGAAVFGILVFAFLQPEQPRQSAQDTAAKPAQSPAARDRALQEAQRKETEQRTRQAAQIKAEQTRQQANMFNQRYNTDRTPVGTVNPGSPDAQPMTQGFAVVKPALPPGQTGSGFREVKWGKQP